MIKKILSIAAIACFTSSFSQNIEINDHNGTTLLNGTTYTHIDTLENDINQDIELELDIVSKFTSSTNIKIKKIEQTTTAPLSKNAICWGVCTSGILWATAPIEVSDPAPMVLNQKITFSGHVYPELHEGVSKFRYVWFDASNPTDSVWVDVVFDIRNPFMVSLNENIKETSLKLFPNPTSNVLNVVLNSNETNKKIEIIDLIGKKVFTKNISGDNTNLKINTSDFLPGIYFVSVSSNNKTIRTSKIVVTN